MFNTSFQNANVRFKKIFTQLHFILSFMDVLIQIGKISKHCSNACVFLFENQCQLS